MPASPTRLKRETEGKYIRRTGKATHLTIEVTITDDGLTKVNGVTCPGPWDVPSQVGNVVAHFRNRADRGDYKEAGK